MDATHPHRHSLYYKYPMYHSTPPKNGMSTHCACLVAAGQCPVPCALCPGPGPGPGPTSRPLPSNRALITQHSSRLRMNQHQDQNLKLVCSNTVACPHCMAQSAPTHAPFPITVHPTGNAAQNKIWGTVCGWTGRPDNRRFHRRRPLFPATHSIRSPLSQRERILFSPPPLV